MPPSGTASDTPRSASCPRNDLVSASVRMIIEVLVLVAGPNTAPTLTDLIRQFGKGQVVTDRFEHEPIHVLPQESTSVGIPSRRPGGHHGSNPRPRLEPALLDQSLNGLMRRIGVNFETRGNGAHRRKWLFRPVLAAHDRADGSEHQLLHDRHSPLQR